MWDSRQFLFAAIAAVLAAGCQSEPASEEVQNAALNDVSPLPRFSPAEQPMDRAALLNEVAQAASATALGQDYTDQQRRLDGKPFEIRIRFGCGAGANPQSSGGDFSVRFGEEDRTLRVRAAPDLTLDDPSITALAGKESEAVEGFWMHRPWLLAEGCPIATLPPKPTKAVLPGAPAETQVQVPSQSEPLLVRRYLVGLAQFFTDADSRTARRKQRAYEATKVLGESERPSRDGYNLVLSGRLRQLPSGQVISCRVFDTEAPPECVVSAAFDRVRIETPGTRDVLAEWGS